MSNARVWRALLGVEHAVIERVEIDDDGDDPVVVVHVRPGRRQRGRCGVCGRRCKGYDQGDGRRRWRHLDAGVLPVYLEGDAPRVACPEHGPTVAAVPWARHKAGHTRAFDDTVAWLAVVTAKTTLCALLRIAWRTVGSIVARVAADAVAVRDPLAGLRRIGIDEISYKRGHRYLTVVVDHDTKRLVWAAPGRDRTTLRRFFDALGPDRAAQVTHGTADGADWIGDVIGERCPGAVLCADPYHLVSWITDALDEVRRGVWNDARRTGDKQTARNLKGARYALWKNPQDLTDRQQVKLAWIAAAHKPLHRAWELKEAFRKVIAVKGAHAGHLLDDWLAWASRSKLKPFIEVARKLRRHRQAIENMLEHDLSNALIESTNTKLRLLMRMAFGFRDTDALIGLAMLALGGYRPDLPGRAS
ncbi:MAG TPA: ISL3 family transposase [Kineosporiaceae bacterium]|nr:ISL3 family transposase [Kineosporiaceae bacterium]